MIKYATIATMMAALLLGACSQQQPAFSERARSEALGTSGDKDRPGQGDATAGNKPASEGDSQGVPGEQANLDSRPVSQEDATGASKAAADVEGAGTPSAEPAAAPPAPQTTAELALACKAAATSGKLKQASIAINFPAAIECNWSQDGNLSKVDAAIRARKEQYAALDIPKATRLCDMKFEFPTQQMQYDDEVFLLLNNYVLASSQDYSVSATYPNGLKKDAKGFVSYKWSGDNGLANLHYGHRLTPRYCLASDPAACQIPETETMGQMKIAVPAERIMDLSLTSGIRYDEAIDAGAPGLKAQLGFVTIGDNDAGDCEHAAYGFQVIVNYLE